MDYLRGSLHKHERLKTRILENPELVGIKKELIISVKTEYPLLKRKRSVAKPDIVIEYHCEKGVCRKFIEVKSGSCRRALESLHAQLIKVSKYLKTKKIDGEVVGVYPLKDQIVMLVI
jgi:hypothetical protein